MPKRDYMLIKLSRNKFAKLDPPDYYRLRHFRYTAARHETTNGPKYYARRHHRKKIISMQYDVLTEPVPQGCLIDHINGDGLDNRRSNLRFATRAQNSRNARKGVDSSIGFKGVRFHRPYRGKPRLRAAIYINRKHKELKSAYDTPKNRIMLAKVYDIAAVEHFGEFAWLNFPEKRKEYEKLIEEKKNGKS